MGNCIRLVDTVMSPDKEIPTERFFKLEEKVDHMESSQKEMAKDVKTTSESMKGIEIAMSELAVIAKQNQNLRPEIDQVKAEKANNSRIDKIESQQQKNTNRLTMAVGALAAITFVLRFFGIEL